MYVSMTLFFDAVHRFRKQSVFFLNSQRKENTNIRHSLKPPTLLLSIKTIWLTDYFQPSITDTDNLRPNVRLTHRIDVRRCCVVKHWQNVRALTTNRSPTYTDRVGFGIAALFVASIYINNSEVVCARIGVQVHADAMSHGHISAVIILFADVARWRLSDDMRGHEEGLNNLK